MRRSASALLVGLLVATPALAFRGGLTTSVPSFSGGVSQGQSGTLQVSGDYPFINLLKTAQSWTYRDNSGSPSPGELDANGYPTFPLHTNGTLPGVYTVFYTPTQAERPGHYVVYATGSGTIPAFTNNGSTATISCTYSLNGGAPQNGTTGTGTCSNLSQCPSVGCTMRWEISVSGDSPSTPEGGVKWTLGVSAVSSIANNYITNLAIFHVNDEALYNAGEQFGTLYKQRISQGKFGGWRHLTWANTNFSTCTWWATRKPTTYVFYSGSEMRPALYAGALSYALNGSSNDYAATFTGPIYGANGSVTFNSGGPVDKQTVIAYVPAGDGATNGTVTFNLNGTGAVPVGSLTWSSSSAGVSPITFSTNYPKSNSYITLVYDTTLAAWLISNSNGGGLNCGVPEEVLLQLNLETGTHPWFNIPPFSITSPTDYTTALATYVKARSPSWMIPRYEVVNETWNCTTWIGIYAVAISKVYWNTSGGTCGAITGGDYNNWSGMAASIVGQAVNAAYGSPSVWSYQVVLGVQTTTGNNVSGSNTRLTSAKYVSSGPSQSGYAQDPAYRWVNRVAMAPYWALAEAATQQEVADAYNYSVGSAGQQATIMGTYTATGGVYIAYDGTMAVNWLAWATGCAGNPGATCKVTGLDAYEGGYSNTAATSDVNIPVTAATNASSAVLSATVQTSITASISGTTLTRTDGSGSLISIGQTITGAGVTPTKITGYLTSTGGTPGKAGTYTVDIFHNPPVGSEAMTANGNGAVAGQTISFTAATGGAWSSIIGNSYTVQSATPTAITINLDSTSLGALSSATLDYTGSLTYINALRTASYQASQVGTLTTTNYNNFKSAGGEFFSMFNLSGSITAAGANPWAVWNPDIYGATQSASDPGTPQWQAIQGEN